MVEVVFVMEVVVVVVVVKVVVVVVVDRTVEAKALPLLLPKTTTNRSRDTFSGGTRGKTEKASRRRLRDYASLQDSSSASARDCATASAFARAG